MNVDYEPDFIDPENGNYQIFSSCLSINAGHQDSTDSDGTVADIGIYPYLNDYSGPDWFITEDGNDITVMDRLTIHFVQFNQQSILAVMVIPPMFGRYLQ